MSFLDARRLEQDEFGGSFGGSGGAILVMSVRSVAMGQPHFVAKTEMYSLRYWKQIR
jgi:hypothetical protein